MTKTLVELSIAVVGLLAVMISQLGAEAEAEAPMSLEKLSGTIPIIPIKLVFMLCEDLPETVVSATRRLN